MFFDYNKKLVFVLIQILDILSVCSMKIVEISPSVCEIDSI